MIERYRHKKRGTTYTQVCVAVLQAEIPCHESAALVVYRGEDGRFWARPHDEFHDGRFEALPPSSEPADPVRDLLARQQPPQEGE